MEKPIEIILLHQAEKFLDELDEPVRKKIMFAMHKTQARLIGDWFVKMRGTEDLFEFRINYSGKFYRLFAFWDSRDEKETLIVGTHGLIKKSNKTPKAEIKKAEDIKVRYFKKLS